MISYPYQCRACGLQFTIRCSISADRSDVRCPCGGVPDQVMAWRGHGIVKGRPEYRFDPRRNARTFRGRRADYEEKVYARTIDKLQVQAREFNERERNKSDGWQIEAIAPAPLVDSINDREGDKNKVLMDPKPFMQDTGLWLGED